MAQQKRTILTLKQKIDVIQVFECEKLNVRDLARRFKIGKTQAAEIVRKKEEITAKWHSDVNQDQKRVFFKTEGYNIDKLCYEWFTKARNKGIPLSSTIIRSKAKEIADNLNYKKFTASSGWWQRFKHRHNIKLKAISGEAASVEPEEVADFQARIGPLIKNYTAEDIYNADETGLFFRALPEKTFALKSEKCTGGKMSKERLTILHCVSMSGKKEKLLVIAKSARPRAFKKINVSNLPVMWRANKKAWMTCDIMSEWLIHFDRRMRLEKRKILLFLDNATSHPRDLRLKNIKVLFLPPNTTALCQPLDQGIIKNFKTFYRSLILKDILTKMESAASASDLVKSINLLDAVYFIDNAWQQVTDSTVRNCFSKAGFKHPTTCEVDNDYSAEDDLPLSIIKQMCYMIKETGVNNVSPNDFINVDDNLIYEDDDLSVPATNAEADLLEDSDEDTEEQMHTTSENAVKSCKEALIAIQDLQSFAINCGDSDALKLLQKLKIHYENAFTKLLPKRQTSILEFYSPQR